MEIPLLLVDMEIMVLEVADPTENSAEMLVIPVELAIVKSDISRHQFLMQFLIDLDVLHFMLVLCP